MSEIHQFPRESHKRPGQDFLLIPAAPEVEELGPHDNMTSAEVLALVARENPPNILVIYQYPDGDTYVRSSQMSRAEANWFLDKAKEQILSA